MKNVHEHILDDKEISPLIRSYYRKRFFENMFGLSLSVLFHGIIIAIFILSIRENTKRREGPLAMIISEKPYIVYLDPVIKRPKDFVPVIENLYSFNFILDSKNTLKEEFSNIKVGQGFDPIIDLEEGLGNFLMQTMPEKYLLEHYFIEEGLIEENETVSEIYNYSGGCVLGPIQRYKGVLDDDRIGSYIEKGIEEGMECGTWMMEPEIPNTPIKIFKLDKSLEWLATVQLENGSWENNPIHTGLSLLCFLGYDQSPVSEKYGKTITGAIIWLIKDFQENGKWGSAYSHGIVTYVIAELYMRSGLEILEPILKGAVKSIIDGQQESGGFDFNYMKGERWDMSVSGWQFQAMKLAQQTGLQFNGLDKAIKKGHKFCLRAYQSGKFDYANRDKVNPGKTKYSDLVNMSSVDTLSTYLLQGYKYKKSIRGNKSNYDIRIKDIHALKEDPFRWDEIAGKNLYGWYYDSHIMWFSNKNDWEKWSNTLFLVLLEARHPDGYWVVNKGHGLGNTQEGKIFATTLCFLQMVVPMHYLRDLQK
ncbi:MAG: hypothetical protein HRT89_18185 [Lentisphaeria bacterium]|nr:hypothetical protein [Lentisphaeria bacterium]NQZ69987.1 hypothetical protein [Lentisphaeria bacterium]